MAAYRIEVINNHLKRTINATPKNVSVNHYVYTLNNDTLTTDQRDFYEHNGYILIKNLISHEILEKCRSHFVDLCNKKIDKGSMVMMREFSLMSTDIQGEYLYNKVQDIFHDETFSLYIEDPKLLKYVACFTGPNIMGMHSMLINKPPGTTPHPPHQDLHYFPFRPAERIVASWTAMEDVFKENGCLYIIPGSHKGRLYEHDYPGGKGEGNNKIFLSIQNEEEIAPMGKRIYLPMEKGDTVFFHPLIIHGSGPNTTNRFRKAISCHYAGSEGSYIDTKNTSQEKVGKEIIKFSKIKNKENMDFKTLMYHRAKLIKGERINL